MTAGSRKTTVYITKALQPFECHKKARTVSAMPIANRHWTFSSLVVSGAPAEPGVYALFEDEEIAYYGCALQGSTIQSALNELLTRVPAGPGGCLQPVNPFPWEISYRPRLREAQLLREYETANQHPPRCNEPVLSQPQAQQAVGQRRLP